MIYKTGLQKILGFLGIKFTMIYKLDNKDHYYIYLFNRLVLSFSYYDNNRIIECVKNGIRASYYFKNGKFYKVTGGYTIVADKLKKVVYNPVSEIL